MRKLALFLGANAVEEKTLNTMIKKWNSPHFKPLDGKFVSGYEMKFNTDWNWIIAVVKAIYALNLDCEEVLLVRDALAEANHKDLFDACMDFVEWYENNLKKIINN